MDANRTLLLLDSAWRDEQAEEHARITGCEETRGESTAVATCKGGLGAKEGGGGSAAAVGKARSFLPQDTLSQTQFSPKKQSPSQPESYKEGQKGKDNIGTTKNRRGEAGDMSKKRGYIDGRGPHEPLP